MEILYFNKNSVNNEPLDITIGAYDGIHDGHLAVINELINNKKHKTAVMTFNIHPDIYLKKRRDLGLIETKEEKEEIFSSLGLDYVIYLEKEILDLTYEDFNLFLKKLNVKRIVVGADFKYGKGALGDSSSLKKDFLVDIVSLVKDGNDKLSSSRIREALKNGDIKTVNSLLKHEFMASGNVVEGSHIGSSLGFKTANLILDEKYHDLRYGVYKVKIKVNNDYYMGVANFGINPTFGGVDYPRLETHIINYNRDLYGKYIEVIFLDFLRDEKKFSSKDELMKQIKEDIKEIGEN